MDRRAITATDAPRPLGAYSHAVAAGGLLFTSGQLPIDPATGQLVGGDIRNQVRWAVENLRAVLRAAGLDLQHVVKTTVFLANIADAKGANEAYAEYFRTEPPARSTVGVALPAGAAVELDAVAAFPS